MFHMLLFLAASCSHQGSHALTLPSLGTGHTAAILALDAFPTPAPSLLLWTSVCGFIFA